MNEELKFNQRTHTYVKSMCAKSCCTLPASALPDKLGDVERVVGAAGARVDAEEELVEPGQDEGGGGGGAGGVQEAGLAHQRRLQDLQGDDHVMPSHDESTQM